MNREPTYYDNLITRYLSGEATPEEILELEVWTNASAENREEFASASRAWRMIREAIRPASTDPAQEWKILKSKLAFTPQETPAVQNALPGPQIHQPVTIPFFRSTAARWSLRIAAAVLLILVPAMIIRHLMSGRNEMQVITALNDTPEVVLPDGSRVTLNKGAVLEYPVKFSGRERRVILTGEAWFEVVRQEDHPFIVDAGSAFVEVLGTSFAVNTTGYGNREEIILQSGKVLVTLREKPSMTVELVPGEKATVDQAGRSVVRSKNDDLNFLAWKTKYIVFENAELNEVAAVLTKVYGLQVRVTGSGLAEYKITATFDRQSPESVLNVLRATLDLEIRRNKDIVDISGSRHSR